MSSCHVVTHAHLVPVRARALVESNGVLNVARLLQAARVLVAHCGRQRGAAARGSKGTGHMIGGR